MFEHFLLTLFGKTFFKWQGRQELKKQKYFKRLDILVGQDSMKELSAEINELETRIDSGMYSGKELRNINDQINEKRMARRTKTSHGRWASRPEPSRST